MGFSSPSHLTQKGRILSGHQLVVYLICGPATPTLSYSALEKTTGTRCEINVLCIKAIPWLYHMCLSGISCIDKVKKKEKENNERWGNWSYPKSRNLARRRREELNRRKDTGLIEREREGERFVGFLQIELYMVMMMIIINIFPAY